MRVQDGLVGTIKPGFIPVARRSQVPLIPIAVVGAYDCLPKGVRLPTRKPIAVVVGEPILAETYLPMSDESLIAEVSERLHKLHDRGEMLVFKLGPQRLVYTTPTIVLLHDDNY